MEHDAILLGSSANHMLAATATPPEATVAALLDETLRLDVASLARFLGRLERGYKATPFHNRVHAADVTHGTAYFLTRERTRRLLSPLDLYVMLLAAALHDFAHPGLTNAFLVETRDERALLREARDGGQRRDRRRRQRGARRAAVVGARARARRTRGGPGHRARKRSGEGAVRARGERELERAAVAAHPRVSARDGARVVHLVVWRRVPELPQVAAPGLQRGGVQRGTDFARGRAAQRRERLMRRGFVRG